MSWRKPTLFVVAMISFCLLSYGVPAVLQLENMAWAGISVVSYQDGVEWFHEIGDDTVESTASLAEYIPDDIEVSWGEGKGLEQVTNTSSYPWSTVCHLALLLSDGSTAFCSGAMADEFHIITAAHCLYNLEFGGWVAGVEAICGQDRNDHPFGHSWATGMSVSSKWYEDPPYDETNEHDWGYIVLDRQKGISTGYMGMQGEDSCGWYEGTTMNLAGYPGSPFAGDCMYFDSGECYECGGGMIFYYTEVYKGMSGGPVWVYYSKGERYKVAVGSGAVPGKYSRGCGVQYTNDLVDALLDAFDESSTPPADFYNDWCLGLSSSNCGDFCCQTDDPCNLANNGYCDCYDSCSWDSYDCGASAGDDDTFFPDDDNFPDDDDHHDDDDDDDEEEDDDLCGI
ncbi:MAG: trypsin-like serine protease [Candidatus Lernaella stagnicola]|nr:trypsin-like serine protease [Candidatus Lernaella stagnicola]